MEDEWTILFRSRNRLKPKVGRGRERSTEERPSLLKKGKRAGNPQPFAFEQPPPRGVGERKQKWFHE